ncbi:MAG: hypothetical protein DRR04_09550 [Gammaproteobacteria bacterium]|nr:MAG: hypothetical protein DRQ97_04560 [Gammaproteobacteria bacterium]RLA59018.1 MAG: hypothetical protein DRR04_09550 [Gammaproteobacteria bacterium]
MVEPDTFGWCTAADKVHIQRVSREPPNSVPRPPGLLPAVNTPLVSVPDYAFLATAVFKSWGIILP